MSSSHIDCYSSLGYFGANEYMSILVRCSRRARPWSSPPLCVKPNGMLLLSQGKSLRATCLRGRMKHRQTFARLIYGHNDDDYDECRLWVSRWKARGLVARPSPSRRQKRKSSLPCHERQTSTRRWRRRSLPPSPETTPSTSSERWLACSSGGRERCGMWYGTWYGTIKLC